jgi:hypothetical protein
MRGARTEDLQAIIQFGAKELFQRAAAPVAADAGGAAGTAESNAQAAAPEVRHRRTLSVPAVGART